MDYTEMAGYYDRIMLKGRYYDYEAIARHLAAVAAWRALELGVGTGLVVEYLLKDRSDYESVAGVDVTAAMLEIARERLRYPQVQLYQQDVTRLDLPRRDYDLAFSYGGVWYFVPDGDGSYEMISHLLVDEDNARGLERVAAHLAPGGRLMLGIQDPHSNYSRALGDGTVYAQAVSPLPYGFRKEYLLTSPDGATLMRQVTNYRVYDYAKAADLLANCGLTPVARDKHHGPMFLEFESARP